MAGETELVTSHGNVSEFTMPTRCGGNISFEFSSSWTLTYCPDKCDPGLSWGVLLLNWKAAGCSSVTDRPLAMTNLIKLHFLRVGKFNLAEKV